MLSSRAVLFHKIITRHYSVHSRLKSSPVKPRQAFATTISKGNQLEKLDENKTFLLHKPRGIVSSFTSSVNKQTSNNKNPPKRTLKELMPNNPNVFPAGRLDEDSEGLLVLTSSRHLASAITNSNHIISKVYYVLAEPSDYKTAKFPFEIEAQQIQKLCEGVWLGIPESSNSEFTLPCKIDQLQCDFPYELQNVFPLEANSTKDQKSVWLRFELKEGKNRQIRRMLATIGLKTLRIVRTQVGPWKLEGIESGKSRLVQQNEMNEFWSSYYDSKYNQNQKKNKL